MQSLMTFEAVHREQETGVANAHSMNPTMEAAEANVKAFAYKRCTVPGAPLDTPVLEVNETLSGSWRRIQLADPGAAFINA